MTPAARIGLFFLALALIFFAVGLRHRRRSGKDSSSAGTWLRIAMIFTVIGIGLQFVHMIAGR